MFLSESDLEIRSGISDYHGDDVAWGQFDGIRSPLCYQKSHLSSRSVLTADEHGSPFKNINLDSPAPLGFRQKVPRSFSLESDIDFLASDLAMSAPHPKRAVDEDCSTTLRRQCESLSCRTRLHGKVGLVESATSPCWEDNSSPQHHHIVSMFSESGVEVPLELELEAQSFSCSKIWSATDRQRSQSLMRTADSSLLGVPIGSPAGIGKPHHTEISPNTVPMGGSASLTDSFSEVDSDHARRAVECKVLEGGPASKSGLFRSIKYCGVEEDTFGGEASAECSQRDKNEKRCGSYNLGSNADC
ncbi:hypothetical protein CBR_g45584 [Chara braunii]|uniref:Uncharacterized protein n=1 Tax=Chara braunii TaxID=69332 RepID=A0A388LYZ6_CHABU|nr:hypothetical protein CBR_g45584 [Chara braunii]|eukprot:GBG87526.1 hypothetical protein CBR_g45584 [Chara braunii]